MSLPDETDSVYINQEIIKYINKTPGLLSILYDIGLLPEQTMRSVYEWNRTLVVTRLYRKIEELEKASSE